MPDELIEFLKQSIASHDRQIGELTDRLAELGEQTRNELNTLTANVNKLVEVTNQDATFIRRLAVIAQHHEERLDYIEGGR